MHADGTWDTASARPTRSNRAIAAMNEHHGLRPIRVHRRASAVEPACFPASRTQPQGRLRIAREPKPPPPIPCGRESHRRFPHRSRRRDRHRDPTGTSDRRRAACCGTTPCTRESKPAPPTIRINGVGKPMHRQRGATGQKRPAQKEAHAPVRGAILGRTAQPPARAETHAPVRSDPSRTPQRRTGANAWTDAPASDGQA